MRKAKSFSHIGNHAINVLARLAAKKAVQEQLRPDGVRVTLVRPAEISAKAQVYERQCGAALALKRDARYREGVCCIKAHGKRHASRQRSDR